MDTSQIMEGSSGRRRIALELGLHTVEARYHKDGTITTKVKTRRKPRRQAKTRTIVILLILLVIELIPVWILYLGHSRDWTAGVWSALGADPAVIAGVLVLFTVGSLIRVRRTVASWHAAEHMAIQAYSETGSIDLADIRRANRINPLCGTRIFLPMILIVASIFYVGSVRLPVGSTGILFGAIAVFLVLAAELLIIALVDQLWGWSHILVFAQASWLIQVLVSTRRPGEPELLTAQRALQELVSIHGPSK